MGENINYFKVVHASLADLEDRLNTLRKEGYNIVQVLPTGRADNTEFAIVTILSPHNPKFLELVKAETEPQEKKNE